MTIAYRWHWTEPQRALLREMWPTHGSLEIARMIGTTRKTVQVQARKMGLANPRAGRVAWSRKREDTLRELWPRMSASLVAEEMGITIRAVLSKAKRLDLPKRRAPLHRPASRRLNERWRSDEQRERVKAMRRQGLKLREIAEREGVSRGVISGLVFRMALSRKDPLSSNPETVARRNRDRRRRAAMVLPTELTVELPPKWPTTCQFVFGNPLRFCTNKRAIVGGRVSMYCKEHGVTIKPTPRLHPHATP